MRVKSNPSPLVVTSWMTTMRTFYIASSFRNIDAVRYVSERLVGRGFIQLYDWTQNAVAHHAETLTVQDLQYIGQKERQAVWDADIVIVVLPGGKGTHVELGLALGRSKRIILYAADGEIDNPAESSTFYHLPDVEKCQGTLDDLLNLVTA